MTLLFDDPFSQCAGVSLVFVRGSLLGWRARSEWLKA